MQAIARFMMIAGVLVFVVGAALFVLGRFDLPLGRLPGDIRIEGENTRFYFPIATSIILSILLTIGLNIFLRFFNK
ncbi:MAG: DUF2905 domain-containing protein [Chloroflexi bacterium]|nr:MAG: DUF2905 domain-containing protein [Chloroflexota bacterium]MBL1196205.1 DUF2905 domain-containing protein [Chloroflexota bacterium]NOH13498.1 DUF2905 domain-containing protein [Chloroflexota bacterium]